HPPAGGFGGHAHEVGDVVDDLVARIGFGLAGGRIGGVVVRRGRTFRHGVGRGSAPRWSISRRGGGRRQARPIARPRARLAAPSVTRLETMSVRRSMGAIVLRILVVPAPPSMV